MRTSYEGAPMQAAGAFLLQAHEGKLVQHHGSLKHCKMETRRIECRLGRSCDAHCGCALCSMRGIIVAAGSRSLGQLVMTGVCDHCSCSGVAWQRAYQPFPQPRSLSGALLATQLNLLGGLLAVVSQPNQLQARCACPKLNAGSPAAVVWVAQSPWIACTTSCSVGRLCRASPADCCEPPFITRLLTYWTSLHGVRRGALLCSIRPAVTDIALGGSVRLAAPECCCVCRSWTCSARRSVAMAQRQRRRGRLEEGTRRRPGARAHAGHLRLRGRAGGAGCARAQV